MVFRGSFPTYTGLQRNAMHVVWEGDVPRNKTGVLNLASAAVTTLIWVHVYCPV